MNQSLRLLLAASFWGSLAACGTVAPTASPEPGGPPTATVAGATVTDTVGPPPTAPSTVVVPSPVATSRGPELEASDPDAARLDAGSLQLVEFFRFT
jgi:hypothetical protein